MGSLSVEARDADLADFFVFDFDADDLAVADLRAAMRDPRSCCSANILFCFGRFRLEVYRSENPNAQVKLPLTHCLHCTI